MSKPTQFTKFSVNFKLLYFMKIHSLFCVVCVYTVWWRGWA